MGIIEEKIKELDEELEGSITPSKCKLIYKQQGNINIKLGYLGYNPLMLQNNCVFFYNYLVHNYIPGTLQLEIPTENLIEINFFDIDMHNYKKIYPQETPVEIRNDHSRYDIGYLKDKNKIIKQLKNNNSIDKIILYKSIEKEKFIEPLIYKNVNMIISLETIKTIKFPFAN